MGPRGDDMRYIALIALVFVVAACGSSAPPVTAHGTLTVYDDPFSGLSMEEAYPDITTGAQVTVTNASGTVIGTGALSYSKADVLEFVLEASAKYPDLASTLADDVAIYTFTVSGLPGGLARYGFTVGKNRATIWVSPSQVNNPGLSLGSLSS
jgi:hypothetical protein